MGKEVWNSFRANDFLEQREVNLLRLKIKLIKILTKIHNESQTEAYCWVQYASGQNDLMSLYRQSKCYLVTTYIDHNEFHTGI